MPLPRIYISYSIVLFSFCFKLKRLKLLTKSNLERLMRFSPADFPLDRFFERRKPIDSFSASLQLELDELRDEMNALSGTLRC